jgi:hypothetical protein
LLQKFLPLKLKIMSESRENLIKQVVAKLAFVDRNGKKRVRIDEIAKISGLEKRIVETNLLFGKVSTLGEELNEESAEALLYRLLNVSHPEIEERLVSDVSQKSPAAVVAETQPTPVRESPANKPPLTLETIIKNFIIVDGSNVLYWMAANNLDDKVNLIPLLIALSAIKRNGFDFCCYFDSKQIFEVREQQPEQFKELETFRKNKRYSKSFSVVKYADDFIVLDAKRTKRKVLSNDNFRDKETRLPRLPKSQLIDGAVANCQITIPKLDIIESLHSNLKKAVRDLETELNK